MRCATCNSEAENHKCPFDRKTADEAIEPQEWVEPEGTQAYLDWVDHVSDDGRTASETRRQ